MSSGEGVRCIQNFTGSAGWKRNHMPVRGARGGRPISPQAYWRGVLGTSSWMQGRPGAAGWGAAGGSRHHSAVAGRYWGGAAWAGMAMAVSAGVRDGVAAARR